MRALQAVRGNPRPFACGAALHCRGPRSPLRGRHLAPRRFLQQLPSCSHRAAAGVARAAAAAAAAATTTAAPAASRPPSARFKSTDLPEPPLRLLRSDRHVRLRGRGHVVLAPLLVQAPPDVPVAVGKAAGPCARGVPPGEELPGRRRAGLVQLREALLQNVQVVAHHLAVRLAPREVHEDLLLHAIPRPGGLRETHERDRLAPDVLPGEGRLRAQPAAAVEPRHRHHVHAILADPLGGRHLAGLCAVPVGRVEEDLRALDCEAARDLRQPDLVADHEGHPTEARQRVHGGEGIPRRRPGSLGGVQVRLAVLCGDALWPQKVSRVVELPLLPPFHKACAKVDALLLRRGGQQLQHLLRVVGRALRVLSRLATPQAPELGQHPKLRSPALGVRDLAPGHPLRALPRVGAA
mmetsp:Transcript_3488/g.10142  ORF Transcript_3488/g.10142 Transcript_3488/m.10142 type:complete len:409 (+) Transcript_3488:512-1738(+)